MAETPSTEKLLLDRINRSINSIIAFVSSLGFLYIFPLLPVGGNYIIPSIISLLIALLSFQGKMDLGFKIFYILSYLALLLNIFYVYRGLDLLIFMNISFLTILYLIVSSFTVKPTIKFIVFLSAALTLHPTFFVFSIPLIILTIALERIDAKTATSVVLLFLAIYTPFVLAMNLANIVYQSSFMGSEVLPSYSILTVPYTNIYGGYSDILGKGSPLKLPIDLVPPVSNIWDFIIKFTSGASGKTGPMNNVVAGLNEFLDKIGVKMDARTLFSFSRLREWINIILGGLNFSLLNYIVIHFILMVMISVSIGVILAIGMFLIYSDFINRRFIGLLEKKFPPFRLLSTIISVTVLTALTIWLINSMKDPLMYRTDITLEGTAGLYSILFVLGLGSVISIRDYLEYRITQLDQLKKRLREVHESLIDKYDLFTLKYKRLKAETGLDVPEKIVVDKLYEGAENMVAAALRSSSINDLKDSIKKIRALSGEIERRSRTLELEIRSKTKTLLDIYNMVLTQLRRLGYEHEQLEKMKPIEVKLEDMGFEETIKTYNYARQLFLNLVDIVLEKYSRVIEALSKLIPEVEEIYTVPNKESFKRDYMILDLFVRRSLLGLHATFSERYREMCGKIAGVFGMEVEEKFKNVLNADLFIKVLDEAVEKLAGELSEYRKRIEGFNNLVYTLVKESGIDPSLIRTESSAYIEAMGRLEKRLRSWRSGEDLYRLAREYTELRKKLLEAMERDKVLIKAASVFPQVERYVKKLLEKKKRVHLEDIPLREEYSRFFVKLFTLKNLEYTFDSSGMIVRRREVV
ncbi:MAG: hypothetical protein DRJ47_00695 [Thermoprotei archaeon]|nr:MAG: hypothetical protein DRJ47_00695 [Thermoprotei archaeon]